MRFRATSKPSFPRRRESRPWDSGNIQRLAEALEILDSRFHGNDEVSDGIVHPPHRHSRAGGKPDLWATAIFKII
ncbi:hypothetical protein BVD88_12370 [Neisseria meningitidis]|nr:hypothetical protein BVD88_12370 [Neisseria meningitidis]